MNSPPRTRAVLRLPALGTLSAAACSSRARAASWKSAAILCSLVLFAGIAGAGCQLPGQRSVEVTAEKPSALLERCAEAIRAMHFHVKAIDRSHLVVIADGNVEGDLDFHPVRLSIKVIHQGGTHYRVEAIATSDERGIRAGTERKARELFFRKLEERGGGAG